MCLTAHKSFNSTLHEMFYFRPMIGVDPARPIHRFHGGVYDQAVTTIANLVYHTQSVVSACLDPASPSQTGRIFIVNVHIFCLSCHVSLSRGPLVHQGFPKRTANLMHLAIIHQVVAKCKIPALILPDHDEP